MHTWNKSNRLEMFHVACQVKLSPLTFSSSCLSSSLCLVSPLLCFFLSLTFFPISPVSQGSVSLCLFLLASCKCRIGVNVPCRDHFLLVYVFTPWLLAGFLCSCQEGRMYDANAVWWHTELFVHLHPDSSDLMHCLHLLEYLLLLLCILWF